MSKDHTELLKETVNKLKQQFNPEESQTVLDQTARVLQPYFAKKHAENEEFKQKLLPSLQLARDKKQSNIFSRALAYSTIMAFAGAILLAGLGIAGLIFASGIITTILSVLALISATSFAVCGIIATIPLITSKPIFIEKDEQIAVDSLLQQEQMGIGNLTSHKERKTNGFEGRTYNIARIAKILLGLKNDPELEQFKAQLPELTPPMQAKMKEIVHDYYAEKINRLEQNYNQPQKNTYTNQQSGFKQTAQRYFDQAYDALAVYLPKDDKRLNAAKEKIKEHYQLKQQLVNETKPENIKTMQDKIAAERKEHRINKNYLGMR